MSDIVNVEVRGLQELQAKIARLPAAVARKAVYASLRKGAAIVRKQAQQYVPIRTGTLKKGFKVARSRIHRGPQQFGIYLALKSGRGRRDPGDPFYGVFVERGYRRGNTTVPGVFFLKRALTENYQASVDAIVADASQRVDGIIAELGL